jgi:small-conductance mechanosensitive channel
MGWRIRRAYRGLGEHLCLVDATRGRHLRRREAQSGPAGEALHAATAKLQQAQPALNEQRRALANETRRAERGLDRYYSAFEAGHLEATRFEQRVSALEARLDALREQDAELAQQLAPQAATSPDAGRTRDGRRQPRNDHRGGRTPAGESPAPPADQRPPRQRQIGNPPDLPRRHARGLRTAKFSGRTWDRTRDLPRVKRALSR